MVFEPSPISYARSGDLSIAYQTFGQGPVDIVIVPGFISNLDLMADTLTFGPILEKLGSVARCVIFDKRGTGLSDRDLGFGSLEERSDDIRAVMDEIGFERASIFGYSEGGPLSVLFAASFPERVEALALYGSFARLWPDEAQREAISTSLVDFVERFWGTGRGLSPFVQGIPDNETVLETVARYERGAASPGKAVDILKAAYQIDATGLLPAVKARTLILHSTGDPLIPVGFGRRLAKSIEGARFVEREADYHFLWDGRKVWWLDDVVDFLTGDRAQPPATDRFLGTVVFTDIVGSTELASSQGDREWTQLIERHDKMAGDVVSRYGGELVKTTGDGFLALFDRPSRAVAGAQAFKEAIEGLGLNIRAGVHTGEIERRDSDLGGIAVHIGARVMSLARDGEVWVSRTVRDLTTGSGLEFHDEGSHPLKGVPGEWDLYSATNSA